MSGGGGKKSHGAASNDSKNAILIPEVCGTLSDGAHMGGGQNGQDAYTGRIIPATVEQCDMSKRLQRRKTGSGSRGTPDSDASRRFL